MKIQDLVHEISEADATELKRLWMHRWQRPTQDAMIAIWCYYTPSEPSDFATGCTKCRSEIIGKIGKLISNIRTHEAQH